MKQFTIILLILQCFLGFGQNTIDLQLLGSGFFGPTDISNAGDERLFIVERSGRIRILNQDGSVNDDPFLDIRNQVWDNQGEQGLLGVVFHPQYEENGYFFVNYTFGNDGTTRISRFTRNIDNANMADPESEKVILEVPQPYSNHNAGDLSFGPDGFLYIGLGDGGSGNDPENRSQNPQTLLGKLLRIDIDTEEPYQIPEDNPFAQEDFTLDEIWAIGLRNPWRFSFDSGTGDLYIADVGQDAFEEINFQDANSQGGENYGWRCLEGTLQLFPDDCENLPALTAPIHEYGHAPQNCGGSVTGGFVYRGVENPSLTGKYLYADFCTGFIWALERNDLGNWINETLYAGSSGWTTFGEDYIGELYIATSRGEIFKIIVPGTTSANKVAKNFTLSLLTNPIEEVIGVEIQTKKSGIAQLQVVDVSGQLLIEQFSQVNQHAIINIDARSLLPGIYFVEIQIGTERIVKKVAKN